MTLNERRDLFIAHALTALLMNPNTDATGDEIARAAVIIGEEVLVQIRKYDKEEGRLEDG